jgi:hypothetical protein
MDPQTAAAVETAVQSGELHRIAAILDAAELEVSSSADQRAAPASRRRRRRRP